METAEVRELIRQELPKLIEHDAELQEWVLRLARGEFADKQRTEDRFDVMLAEIRAMREESERKWAQAQAESARKWEAQERKWEEQQQAFKEFQAESARKWEEQQQALKEFQAESARKWEETLARMDKHEETTLARMNEHEETTLARMDKREETTLARVDRRLSAMGARWGISSERAFRDALAAILEQSFGVQVLNVNEYDDEGVVFGHPDQVELDVIIKNGLLILCELKSSMSKGDMYLFQRKADWYERRHGRKAARRLVISPMIDRRAKPVGERLGFELYGDSSEVEA